MATGIKRFSSTIPNAKTFPLSMNDWITLLHTFKTSKTPVAMVTVTQVLGSAPCKIGSKMIVTHQKEIFGTIGGGKLEFHIITQAQKAIQENQIQSTTYTLGPEFEQCCGGKVTLLIEPMNQNPELYLFGAGHIGVALCEVLANTPFQITLLDTREQWKNTLSLPSSVTYSAVPFDLYKSTVHWGPNCYAIIVTHDHKLDFEITALCLAESTKFIGLIGSKTKRNKFHHMLRDELGFESGMNPVHCPVGLDLGGHTPKEIAISIAAQLLQVCYEK